jgi:hypothetical protein
LFIQISRCYHYYCFNRKQEFSFIYLNVNYFGDFLNARIQGVSEFHRQTFRADSRVKNRHKLLNTYGVKNA